MENKAEQSWVLEFITNIWPIVLAAFLGALAAFLFQKWFEAQKQRNLDFRSGKHAQFALISQFTALTNVITQYLNEHRENEDRFLALHPFSIHFDFINIDIESLLYILDDGEDANLLNMILIAEQKFKTAMGILEQRSKYHADFQHKAAKIGIDEALDIATKTILIDMTDNLYETFDDAIDTSKEINDKLFQYLKTKFPKKTPLQYKRIDEMNEEDMNIKKYDVALATRNFEIELFWKRSVFFWGFIAAAFVGYATLVKDKPSLAIIIACFGFVCSVAWSLVNRGSKYWQENWESIVGKIEDNVTGSLFKDRGERQQKGIWLSSRRFSVSKVTIALSDFTSLIWFSLMSYHLLKILKPSIIIESNTLIALAIIGSIIFAIAMACIGRSSEST